MNAESSSFIFGQFPVARKLIINGGAIRPTGLLFLLFRYFPISRMKKYRQPNFWLVELICTTKSFNLWPAVISGYHLVVTFMEFDISGGHFGGQVEAI